MIFGVLDGALKNNTNLVGNVVDTMQGSGFFFSLFIKSQFWLLEGWREVVTIKKENNFRGQKKDTSI